MREKGRRAKAAVQMITKFSKHQHSEQHSSEWSQARLGSRTHDHKTLRDGKKRAGTLNFVGRREECNRAGTDMCRKMLQN